MKVNVSSQVRRRRGGLLLALLAALGGLVWLMTQADVALAANFTVTRFDDPTPNGCLAGDCSLREAIIAANTTAGADLIFLPAGNFALTLAGTGEDAAATGDLDILETVTIIGSGAGATIDAGGIDRVFHVIGGGGAPVVTFSKLTIRGGALTTAGAAGSGGGIRNDGGTVILSYSVVRNNSVTPGYSDCGGGGGIFNDAGSVTLSNSSAIGNTSDSFGGGISSVEGVVILSGASLDSNIAEVQGGGLYNIDGSVVISGSAVTQNEVGTLIPGPTFTEGRQPLVANCGGFLATDGGGIFSNSGSLVITNTLISSNYGNTGVHGAGIATRFSNNMSLENVAFLNNSSVSSGGAIMINGGLNEINNSLFQSNYSNGRGGAIFVRDDEDANPGTLIINHTDFISNVAEYNGIGVYGGTGGGIHAYSSAGTVTVEMNQSTLIGNQALGSGLSEARGGAIHIDEYQPITSTVLFTLNDTTVDNNHADEEGGALYNRGGYVTMNDTTLSHNSASVGGGIYTYSTSRVVLNNSTISGNTADLWGAFYNGYTAGEMFLNNVTISDNSSPNEVLKAWGGSPAHFRSSIIDTDQTCAGDIVSQGYNIGPASCNFTEVGDLIGDPLLLPLADNGGETQTHALSDTSPAIDAGNPAGCEADFDGDGLPESIFTLDQRGEPRVDIPGVGHEPPDDGCDMGAYEYQPVAALILNGGFEIDSNGDGRPDYWQAINAAPEDGQYCTFAHGGLCSFYSTATGPTKFVYQVVNRSGAAGDSYQLSVWAATRNAAGTPTGAVVILRYADGSKQTFTKGYNLGTHGWQNYHLNFTAQKNYTSIIVIPIYNNLTAGELLVDDVTLTPQP